jgi:DNA-binding NtrC family response regulator
VAESASDGEEALEKVTTFRPAIVITDLIMPRMDGLALLRALQQQGADVTTLLLTRKGTVETAVEAMKEGAYDYLTKPVDIQRLKILLDKIVERLETMREVKALRRQLREHGAFGSLIGNSPEMRKIYQVVELAAPTGASVLITGESGHGQRARRADHPPVESAGHVSLRRDQLRGDSGDAAGERDLRPRERRFHRRGRSPSGLLRAGGPRHAVSR